MKTKLWGSPYIPSAAVSTCKNGFMQEHFFFLISFGALKMKTHFSRSLWLKKRKKKKGTQNLLVPTSLPPPSATSPGCSDGAGCTTASCSRPALAA